MFEGSEVYRIWVPGVSVCLPFLAPNCLGQKHMSYLGLFPVLPPGLPGVEGHTLAGGGEAVDGERLWIGEEPVERALKVKQDLKCGDAVCW